jgi:hypothetical protein
MLAKACRRESVGFLILRSAGRVLAMNLNPKKYGANIGIGRHLFEHAAVRSLPYICTPSLSAAFNWGFSHANC